MLVAVGTRMTWVEVIYSGARVSAPGLPPIPLGGGELRLDASAVGAGYVFGLGLLLALVPLGWLATGPRARVALSVLGLAIAIGIGLGVATVRGDLTSVAARKARTIVAGNPSASYRIASSAGAGLTAAGAALGGLSCIAGAGAGARIPRMRMPDKPGEDTWS